LLFTKAINGRLTLNGSLADHCLTPSCLCVLRRDAEARHNVGFFRYGGNYTIQDVWVVAIYQKKAVSVVQAVVCLPLYCRRDGKRQPAVRAFLLVEILASGQRHCRALGRLLSCHA